MTNNQDNKSTRKLKWRNTTLNSSNIDEYLQDLYDSTAGNYITQGVSFNKDDIFQMTLLKNVLVANGSFSGFIKQLLYAHFDKTGKLDTDTWQPSTLLDLENADESQSPTPTTVTSSSPEEEEFEEAPVIVEKPTLNRPTQRNGRNRLDSYNVPPVQE